MPYVITYDDIVIQKRLLPKLDKTTPSGVVKDKAFKSLVFSGDRPLVYTYYAFKLSDLHNRSMVSEARAKQAMFKRISYGEQATKAFNITVDSQHTNIASAYRLKKDLFKVVEVPELTAMPLPQLTNKNTYGFKAAQNMAVIKRRGRASCYCIKCAHIIPKDMERLALSGQWGICPLCVVDMASEFVRAAESYDSGFMEEMKVTRALGNL